MVRPAGSAIVPVSEFGPLHPLVARAHQLYIDGFSEQAVLACREGLVLTAGAGDRRSTQFLRYVQGITLQEVGRHHEAVTVALDLLVDVEDDPDPMWRAKTLALLAESSTAVNEVSRAMDALAEATWLIASTKPGLYSHLSASTAVAVALRAVYLFEQADELLHGIRLGDDVDIDLLVIQECALMDAFWATTLLVVGHAEAARPHLVNCAEQSLRMARFAKRAGSDEMVARAEVIEAYAMSRLGYADLAAARVNAAIRRFQLRGELVETHLAYFVLGQAALEAGRFDEARQHLHTGMSNAKRATREIWAAASTEALAELDTAEHGPHPAVDTWKLLAREALERVWVERDGRFTALQTRNQVRALTAETSRMGEEALLDPLTGLGNRQMMTSAIDHGGESLSAVFVDVDQFKQVNDYYSHSVGDEVLRRIAVILRTHCRADDVPVRYGGDEFLILVFGGDEAAEEVATRLHAAVRTAPWEQVAPDLRVTVSVGVGHKVPSRGAIAAADAALYEAKRAGRDRVVSV